jgi:hypothetical protein
MLPDGSIFLRLPNGQFGSDLTPWRPGIAVPFRRETLFDFSIGEEFGTGNYLLIVGLVRANEPPEPQAFLAVAQQTFTLGQK